MSTDARNTRWLVLAFATVILCFVASTAYAELQAQAIGDLSKSLSGNAMPSIQHLAAARAGLRHVQALATKYATAPDEGARAKTGEDLLEAQRTIDRDVDAYLHLPIYPGEEEIWAQIRKALSNVDAAIATTRAYVDAGDEARARASVGALDAACDGAVAAVMADIRFNAENGERIAQQISQVRRRARVVALGLDAVSVVLTVLVAFLAMRAIAARARLLRRHNELLAIRADELEQFAGRVAHDIRNPLHAATFSLSFVQRLAADNKKANEVAGRGLSNLMRASRIVDGLLSFARAGARPPDDARADVRAIVETLLDDLRPAAEEAQVELTSGPLAPVSVRCAPSILEVLLSNLVRNAIKYMGEGPLRRVTVRALDLGDAVRVEVEDTGLGVPPQLRGVVFEPFVRGRNVGQEGIGLGLATVKRIADTHGGRVGLEPLEEHGSRFWFELPKAPPLPTTPKAEAGMGANAHAS